MRAVIVDSDHHEVNALRPLFNKRFPSSTLQHFKCLGDFLLDPEAIYLSDIILTEQILNLWKVTSDTEAEVQDLQKKFPDILSNWEPYQGGGRLIVHVRRERSLGEVPIIVYTAIEKELIDNRHWRMFEIPNVEYCQKDIGFEELFELIYRMTSARSSAYRSLS